MGFTRIAAAGNGAIGAYKGVFPGGIHQSVQELKNPLYKSESLARQVMPKSPLAQRPEDDIAPKNGSLRE